MTTTIRRAGEADLPQLVDQRIRFITELSPHDLDGWDSVVDDVAAALGPPLRSGRYVSWVADRGEALVGCVGVSLIDIPPRTRALQRHDGLVLTMWVEPEWRSRGVGRRLVQAILDARDELSICRLLLHATDAGRPLYESLGFTANPTLMDLTHVPADRRSPGG